ncbi:sur7 protein [Rutstroemia sp. NJR-2017a BBW]|nr:sur7 protein [Rutstroemia sp. NJR-2017a BBW]
MRLHALISFLTSLVAFLLGGITIFSGSNDGVLGDYYFMRSHHFIRSAPDLTKLKTLNLGHNLVEFAPVNATTANTTSTIDISSLTSRSTPLEVTKRDAASDFATALFGMVVSAVREIIDKIKVGDSNGLNEIENEMVTNVTDAVGLADFYSLHVMRICRGSISTDSRWSITSCSNYSDALSGLTQLTAATPSTFRIINTTLTIPLLGLASTSVPNTASLLNIGTIAILALYGLALIGSGATMILSLIYLFKPSSRIGYCALFFSFLGMNFTLTFTLNLTAVTIMVKNVVSQLEPALGVEASSGSAFLGSSWVAVTCCLVYNQYWIIVWLVEIRTIAFKRRTRTDEEIGNWKGAVRELKDDFKKPVEAETNDADSSHGLIAPGERVEEQTVLMQKKDSHLPEYFAPIVRKNEETGEVNTKGSYELY